MKILIHLAFLFTWLAARAQNFTVDTNYLFIGPAGTAGVQGEYHFTTNNLSAASGTLIFNGGYTNLNGNGMAIGTAGGIYSLGNSVAGYYTSVSGLMTNFPAAWEVNGGAAPAPTGWFLTTPWQTGMTNYWTVPGDQIAFQAAGINLALPGESSNTVSVLLGGRQIFQSPFTSAGGVGWQLTGTSGWDGTNLNCAVQFASGDPNNPIASSFTTLTNATVSASSFMIVFSDTDKLTLTSSSITAQRAPQSGDIAAHVYVQPITEISLIDSNSVAWWVRVGTNGSLLVSTNR